MSERLVSLLGYAVAAFMAGSLALSAAHVTWHLMGYDDSTLLPPIGDGAATTQNLTLDIGPILALAPFGVPAGKAGPAIADQPVPGLILRGVFVAPDGRSSALIAVEPGTAKLFVQGQTIASGAVLEDVQSGHVVISRNGQRQILPISKKPASSGKAPRPAPPGVVPGFASTVPAQPASPKPAPDEIIDRYRQQIAANPQSVLDTLGVAATAQGYRIGQNLSPAVASTGLLAGDIIVRVNGAGVGNIEHDRQLFEQIASAGSARVELIRGGRLLTLTFPLR